MGVYGFITTTTGGDIAVVSAGERFLISRGDISRLIADGGEATLVLPGGVIDAESRVAARAGSDRVAVVIRGRVTTVGRDEFFEVASGQVQWAPLAAFSGELVR